MLKKRLSSILSSSLGNILEWYDFGLFTIFSALFGKLFFPTQEPKLATIATFGIFSIGFLCRPLGALIFGYLGDKKGRAITLRLSVLMISLPTLLIAFLPTYQQAGIFAPLSLTLIRMWQGISIGGEYSGNMIYLAETAPQEYRATFTSFAGMGSNFGIFLAAIVGIILTSIFSDQTIANGVWRLPYLISGLLSFIIYLFRMNLQETATFNFLKKQHLIPKNPIRTVFSADLPALLRTLGMVCMGTTFYYYTFIYLPLYFEKYLHFSMQDVSMLISILIAFMIILLPILGLICDKIGRRPLLLLNSVIITLILIPGSFLLGPNFLLTTFVLILFTLLSAAEQATTGISVVENFPAEARYTGVSLGYNLGNGFLGGTVPIVCAWILTISDSIVPVAAYIALFALTTLIVVYVFVPETKNQNLDLTVNPLHK